MRWKLSANDLSIMDKIERMMDYLGYKAFPIQSNGMRETALPLACVSQENWCPERDFILSKSGRLTYYGWGSGFAAKTVYDLIPSGPLLERAYRLLADECIQRASARSIGSQMHNAAYLILRFYGLDFLRQDGRIRYRFN